MPTQPGWSPVNSMIRLAGRLFEAPIIPLDEEFKVRHGIQALSLGRKRNSEKPDALLVVAKVNDLRFFVAHEGWRTSYNRVFAWIIDSFWTDRLLSVSLARVFDGFFVAYGGDVETYERRTGVPTFHLPWGADALSVADVTPDRPIDLQRIGRQPDPWQDDETTAKACEMRGIAFAGRPPFLENPLEQQRVLMGDYLCRAKFVLAFSNRVNATGYTHPDVEYVTGRWTDALACGCVVMGVPPYTDPLYRNCFWPEGGLELDTIDREPGLDALQRALKTWTPEVAQHNRVMALKYLDWRWRFLDIARMLGERFPKLDQELRGIDERLRRK